MMKTGFKKLIPVVIIVFIASHVFAAGYEKNVTSKPENTTELKLELEGWMFVSRMWDTIGVEIETDRQLTLEAWMLKNSIWLDSILYVHEDKDVALELEQWMIQGFEPEIEIVLIGS